MPYPFLKMTAFQGFADMEYPGMVNDSQTGDDKFAQLMQDHEIAHTYFPFYMGINETRYAFMDEGWATFDLVINYQDGNKETKHYTPSVWKTNQKLFSAKFKGKIKSTAIENGIFVDATPGDNIWKTN